MQEINTNEQATQIRSDQSYSLVVSLLGCHDVLSLLPHDTLTKEISAGAWSKEAANPSIGPAGRSLLLCLLGAIKGPMSRHNYGRKRLVDPSSIARALVSQGCHPEWKDDEGRDSIDQAFELVLPDLLSEWTAHMSPLTLSKRRSNHLPWLHRAVNEFQYTLLSFLIEKGLDINQVNEHGETPLFFAQNAQMVETLLSLGANPHHRNQNGVDARAFWSRQGITQSDFSEMSAKIPKNTQELPRSVRLKDFYAVAMTAGKTAFSKEIRAVNLKPEDLFHNGLGPIGILGDRLADPNSKLTGIEKNKTLACTELMVQMSEMRAGASEKDIKNLWVGATIFGSSYIADICLKETPYAKAPRFWIECFDLLRVKIADESRFVVMEALNGGVVSFGKLLGKISSHEAEYTKMLDSFVSLNLKGAQTAIDTFSGGDKVKQFQKAVLNLIRANPGINRHLSDDIWTLALMEGNASGYQREAVFFPDLASHMLEQNYQVPVNKLEAFKLLTEGKPGLSHEALSNLNAQILMQQTHTSHSTPRRSPRL